MKLRTARLCLDCDEVHDAYRCPACTSESFAYITRWVPEPERHRWLGPTTSPEAEVYRALVQEDEKAAAANAADRGRRALKRGVLGIAAVGVLGWLWNGRGQKTEQ